jgi:hypothetical protein
MPLAQAGDAGATGSEYVLVLPRLSRLLFWTWKVGWGNLSDQRINPLPSATRRP